VTIDHLVNDFEAVQMPHRKMVLRMAELIRNNRLAAFHTQATTVCQGCHHHSPTLAQATAMRGLPRERRRCIESKPAGIVGGISRTMHAVPPADGHYDTCRARLYSLSCPTFSSEEWKLR
jgi:hypothetical protein